MKFPQFIQDKMNENGYKGFCWDSYARPSSHGKWGDGFYLNTRYFKYWSSTIIDLLNEWMIEWNQENNNEVISIETFDIDWDDDRIWEAGCSFYIKGYESK